MQQLWKGCIVVGRRKLRLTVCRVHGVCDCRFLLSLSEDEVNELLRSLAVLCALKDTDALDYRGVTFAEYKCLVSGCILPHDVVYGACGVGKHDGCLTFSEEAVCGGPAVSDSQRIAACSLPPVKVCVSIDFDGPEQEAKADGAGSGIDEDELVLVVGLCQVIETCGSSHTAFSVIYEGKCTVVKGKKAVLGIKLQFIGDVCKGR